MKQCWTETNRSEEAATEKFLVEGGMLGLWEPWGRLDEKATFLCLTLKVTLKKIQKARTSVDSTSLLFVNREGHESRKESVSVCSQFSFQLKIYFNLWLAERSTLCLVLIRKQSHAHSQPSPIEPVRSISGSNYQYFINLLLFLLKNKSIQNCFILLHGKIEALSNMLKIHSDFSEGILFNMKTQFVPRQSFPVWVDNLLLRHR